MGLPQAPGCNTTTGLVEAVESSCDVLVMNGGKEHPFPGKLLFTLVYPRTQTEPQGIPTKQASTCIGYNLTTSECGD